MLWQWLHYPWFLYLHEEDVSHVELPGVDLVAELDRFPEKLLNLNKNKWNPMLNMLQNEQILFLTSDKLVVNKHCLFNHLKFCLLIFCYKTYWRSTVRGNHISVVSFLEAIPDLINKFQVLKLQTIFEAPFHVTQLWAGEK